MIKITATKQYRSEEQGIDLFIDKYSADRNIKPQVVTRLVFSERELYEVDSPSCITLPFNEARELAKDILKITGN